MDGREDLETVQAGGEDGGMPREGKRSVEEKGWMTDGCCLRIKSGVKALTIWFENLHQSAELLASGIHSGV